MTLPASGPLAMTDIQTEFGGTNPIGLNEYYAGGGLVPPGTSGTYGAVPSSGALSIQNFYGTSNFVPIYIEDVFSTWLYTGNGTSQTITNGIDLAGEGGLVWIKGRTNTGGEPTSHLLTDTARGAGNWISSQSTSPQATGSDVTSFTSSGFGLTNSVGWGNINSVPFVSWTFRKQPKFFDIVTYTGTGDTPNNVTVSHNLGSTPGFIITKAVSSVSDWTSWHRSAAFMLQLNRTDAASSTINNFAGFIDNVTSTSFRVNAGSNANDININGVTYVAYVFAHDAGGFGLTGTDNVISCGSFTTDGSGNATVSLGYEPQWLMVKRTDSGAGGSWFMFDTMRYMALTNASFLYANASSAETGPLGYPFVFPTATGFTEIGQFPSAASYIYIAIRRGPMKVPESGTSVFSPNIITTSTRVPITTGFPVDWQFLRYRDNASPQGPVYDRLRGVGSNPDDTFVGPQLDTTTTGAEINNFNTRGWGNTGFVVASPTNTPVVYWNFRRAPGFFDEVCYTGTGVARTVAHNLTVVPELMIVKCRSSSASWLVYSAATGSRWYLVLNTTREKAEDTAVWNNTTPTASVFSLGNAWVEANQSGQTYVAYLFASCPGVSKAGGYTGTGTTQTINCGFTTGARFVLIKRTDADGFAWYVWDSARGIVAGNDPYLLLNSTAAEVTNTDYVDTAATGFEISSTAPAALNASGGTYIFLAIA